MGRAKFEVEDQFFYDGSIAIGVSWKKSSIWAWLNRESRCTESI